MSERKRPTAMELIDRSIARPEAKQKKIARQASPRPPPNRLHEVQSKIWDEVVATIELLDCDLFLVETLVCLLDQQRTLQRAVNKDGPIITQPNGRPMHNPAATALRQIESQLTRCFKELGMSPATRARLKLDNRTRQRGAESRWAKF